MDRCIWPGTSFDFSTLTPAERKMLVEALCDSLSPNETGNDLSSEQLDGIRRRVAEVREGRAEPATWKPSMPNYPKANESPH